MKRRRRDRAERKRSGFRRARARASTTAPPRSRTLAGVARLVGLGAIAATGTAGATGLAAWPPAGQDAVPRLGLLPDGPFSTMSMRLEKTIFKVDVLDLAVRLAPPTARAIRTATSTVDDYRRSIEGPVAQLAIRTPEAVATIDFLRDVSLGQFLGGVDDDMRRALDVGWLEEAAYEEISAGLRVWFGFLEERRIRDGDRLAYHIRGDTLRTVFEGVEGQVLLDQTDVGRQNVLALLGAYFAPGSSFRRKLIESLWEDAGD